MPLDNYVLEETNKQTNKQTNKKPLFYRIVNNQFRVYKKDL